ncbi:MAG: DUF2997 domain-containing protein [cyanobacterium endosymbiont of Epithemia adnata isolate EadnSB Bon19]|jgi:hypothetical protein|nr:DUF2997 domain-containing protein [cyanobacterium endosymbiont of Epithemia turgida]
MLIETIELIIYTDGRVQEDIINVVGVSYQEVTVTIET